MGFGVNYVVDILKFPWPLFPKNKNAFPLGLRYDIPALVQDNEFTITLPAGNIFEITGLVFSTTGYKDGDSYSLIKNNEYIAKEIYTKELGQAKEIRPVKEINSDTDTLKFIFHNTTGTSKVIWVDIDMTCKNIVLYDEGAPYLMDSLPEEVKVALPYIKDGEYPELRDINTDYWADDLQFGIRSIRKPFWEGRNDILHMWSMYQSKVAPSDSYRKFIYQLSVDAKNNIPYESFDRPFDEFVLEYNHLIDSSFSPKQLAEVYLTYKLKTPVTIFDPAMAIVTENYIDILVQYVDSKFCFVLDWIDFNEVNSNAKVLGFEISPYSVYNDNRSCYDNKIKAFINIEPSAFGRHVTESKIVYPLQYRHNDNLKVEYLPFDTTIRQAHVDITDPNISFVELFLHELAHALDGYRRDACGVRFSQMSDWLKIAGWESEYFKNYTHTEYPPLKVTNFISFNEDRIEPPVTPYGCTNPLEDFAESFVMYCINPICLQVHYPKRWKFFEDHVINII